MAIENDDEKQRRERLQEDHRVRFMQLLIKMNSPVPPRIVAKSYYCAYKFIKEEECREKELKSKDEEDEDLMKREIGMKE